MSSSLQQSERKSSGSRFRSTMPRPAWAAAIAVLVLGAVLGYLFSRSGSAAASAGVSQTVQSNETTSPAQTQASFDTGMRPLLDRLQGDPNDSALLTDIGNRYYDHQDWGHAVEYYRRLLQLQPDNVNVRTDMGTAIWYGGDPWNAVREYKTVLTYKPDYAQALFNMGIVQWQGEHDDRAALQSWQTLLRVHPDYSDRQRVEQFTQRVQAELKEGAPSSGR